MTHPNPETLAAKLIISGIHLDLTDAIRTYVINKTSRLLRHNDQIVRLRIDVKFDQSRAVGAQFDVHGQIEIGGPDLIANATSDDAYKSIDLLVDKLDGLLRRRHGLHKDKRNHPHDVELDAAIPKAT